MIFRYVLRDTTGAITRMGDTQLPDNSSAPEYVLWGHEVYKRLDTMDPRQQTDYESITAQTLNITDASIPQESAPQVTIERVGNQSSPAASSIAAALLNLSDTEMAGRLTDPIDASTFYANVRTLAGSVLTQDETGGQDDVPQQ